MSRRSSTRQHRKQRTNQFVQRPWGELRNRLPPIEILHPEQVEEIHQGSLKILRDIGIRIENADALAYLARAGADVDHDTMMVRFDPSFVEEMIQGSPSGFTVLARDPAKSLYIGDNSIVFSATAGPAFVSDLDRGRRPGTHADMCDFIKLVHSLNIIHHEGGGGVEPLDLPAETRYLDMMYAQCTLTDKTWHPCWYDGRERANDVIEMARINLGLDREQMAKTPGLVNGICTNTPLLIDGPLSESLIEFVKAGQPMAIAGFTMAGATSPATLAAAITLQNAEILAGFVLIQSIRRGAPMIYGNFATNVDLKTGGPAFGTPEHAKAAQAAAQMARRYGVPFRSSNTTGSNSVDAQAAYESSMSLWGTVMGHTNVMRHAGGWLEGGLTCSFEKLIMDAEILQMMAEYLEPIEVSRETLALDVIAEVGPGGHFLGTADTLKRCENAFYTPIMSDWRAFETWSEDGSKSATERANEVWKKLLDEYEKPPIAPAVEEELQAYVARRKEEITKRGG